MKKRMAIVVTVGVWVAALGSAAALAYELNRPLRVADGTSERAAPIENAESAAIARPVLAPPVLYVPTITIVGRALPRPAAVEVSKPIVDISQMHCADWRGLDMGSGRVQVCE